MHYVVFTSIVIVWTVLTKSCGAWVYPIQNAFNNRPITTSESVHGALVKAAIIPDGKYIPDGLVSVPFLLLDDFQPSAFVTLSYASKHKTVDLGNRIKPKKVTSPPIFNIDVSAIAPSRTLSNTTYTLVLSDPDATSRAEPVMAQMCHWIVTNLTLPFQSSNSDQAPDWPSSSFSLRESENNGIEEIMPYIPPTPPPKTGYHRYVFVLLAPVMEEDMQRELTKPRARPHWGYGKVGAGVRDWANENGLVAVGANFFYSKDQN